MEHFKRIDQFSESVKLNYEGGADTYKTVGGSIVTLILFACLLAYSLNSFIKLMQGNDAIINSYQEDFLNEEKSLSPTLDIAVAVTTHIGGNAVKDFADYGSLVSYYEVWDGEKISMVNNALRPCTLDDFGIGTNNLGENQSFYTA